MSTITKSIGTQPDPARDYETMTLWEADLGGAAGGAGNDAVGECYADSDFDESVLINNVTPDSIRLSVASGERHNGIAGSGVRLLFSVNDRQTSLAVAGAIAEWIEYDCNGKRSGQTVRLDPGGGVSPVILRNAIIHGAVDNGTCVGAFIGDPGKVFNTIIYDFVSTSTSTQRAMGVEVVGGGSDIAHIYNCTIYKIVNNGGSGNAAGVSIDDDNAAKNVFNTIAMGISGTTSGTVADFIYAGTLNSTIDYNMDEDGSLPAAMNNQRGKTVADQFISTANGSENLHIKTGSDAIDTGTDLGTTDGVNIDIDGRDREAEGDIWDIGADEFVSGVVPSPVPLLKRGLITGYHCFMNSYLNAKVEGLTPLKLPDGTVF